MEVVRTSDTSQAEDGDISWGPDLVSEVRAGSWNRALNLWGLMLTPGNVRTELNDIQLVSDNWLVCVGGGNYKCLVTEMSV